MDDDDDGTAVNTTGNKMPRGKRSGNMHRMFVYYGADNRKSFKNRTCGNLWRWTGSREERVQPGES